MVGFCVVLCWCVFVQMCVLFAAYFVILYALGLLDLFRSIEL